MSTDYSSQNEYYYQVFDGSYVSSPAFANYEAAANDAALCLDDENCSGNVFICRYEVGDGGHGEAIEQWNDQGHFVCQAAHGAGGLFRAPFSFAVKAIYDDLCAADLAAHAE